MGRGYAGSGFTFDDSSSRVAFFGKVTIGGRAVTTLRVYKPGMDEAETRVRRQHRRHEWIKCNAHEYIAF